jgi:hypothetical protein
MMTKYQLVFVKLETLMHKILMNIEARKRLRIKKGFLAFRTNAMGKRIEKERKNNKERLVIASFEMRIGAMMRVIERYQERAGVGKAFR